MLERERRQPDAPSDVIVVLAPLALEARAVRAGAPWADVRRVGMGPRRAARSAQLSAAGGSRPTLIAGFCGALDPALEPGDIVLASELRGPDRHDRLRRPDDPRRRAAPRRTARPHRPDRLQPAARHRRAPAHARPHRRAAVDMESAWLAPAARGRPLVTLRVVRRHAAAASCTVRCARCRAPRPPTARCAAPARCSRSGPTRSASARSCWPRRAPRAPASSARSRSSSARSRIAARRSTCASRSSTTPTSSPTLEQRGAVFVDELDEVPEGATVIFSAHGVSPAVRSEAQRRQLDVVDATCPLVAKVHAEARRFAADGFDIVLVGHEGHEEVEGTVGEAPERTQVIAAAEEVAGLRGPRSRAGRLPDPDDAGGRRDGGGRRARCASASRTPSARRPSDICYATQNRQDAVRALARGLRPGPRRRLANSSNSRRLVEVAAARRLPVRMLVEDAADIPPGALAGVRRVGRDRRRLGARGAGRGGRRRARRAGRGDRRRSVRVATENDAVQAAPRGQQRRSLR